MPTMSQGQDFTLEWGGECAIFRLTRPEKRNAITLAIVAGLERCCDELDAGRGRALILTGEGDKAFCAGTDLSESASLGAEASQAKGTRARDLVVRHEECRLRPVFGNASRISHLDLASAYASRSSYKMAQDAVDQVLRRNPLDQEARRLAEHIQLLRAASSGF